MHLLCGSQGWVSSAGLARETANLQKLSMMHVYGDPLKHRDLKDRIAVEKFNSAIILCDAAWVDPDQVIIFFPAHTALTASDESLPPVAQLQNPDARCR